MTHRLEMMKSPKRRPKLISAHLSLSKGSAMPTTFGKCEHDTNGLQLIRNQQVALSNRVIGSSKYNALRAFAQRAFFVLSPIRRPKFF